MKNITITDVTMRGQTELNLSFREKIELAKQLDRLGVPVIETAPISDNRTDRLLIKSIASAVKESTVAVPIGLKAENIPLAANALEEAVKPRLVIEAPVSAVQMEYLAGLKPAAMTAKISSLIKEAVATGIEVEFCAEDATRADPVYLYEVLKAAVEEGAAVVTIGDAAGAFLPEDFGAFVSDLLQKVPELASVTLGVGCSNALYMADSCAIAAVRCGAGEIKAAACGSHVVSLEHVAALLAAKGDSFNACTGIRVTQLRRSMEQIRRLCHLGTDTAASPLQMERDEGVVLTKYDDISAVLKAVQELGYELSEEDGARVFEAFGPIAARKEKVSSRELEAIVASAAMQVPPTYLLESYVINTGNVISASAHLRLTKNGASMESISLGDGPIDAAFRAMDEILGHHYELDDFQIQSVTEGREAMGEALVKLRSGGKLYSGRGISTDIIGASIQAYLNALNKIAYEEGNQ